MTVCQSGKNSANLVTLNSIGTSFGVEYIAGNVATRFDQTQFRFLNDHASKINFHLGPLVHWTYDG